MLKNEYEIPQRDSNHVSAPQQVEFKTSTLKEQNKDN